ncbi:MAG: threonine synthase [Calditrichia bacterium]|jgi:threonine synthase
MYLQQCVSCGKQYNQDQFLYTCPDCGDLKGTLDILYDYDDIRDNITRSVLRQWPVDTIFKYSTLLPLTTIKPALNLKVGMTPLYQFPDLAEKSGIESLYIKDDSYNPSLTLKDRASAVSLIKAQELNFNTVATASTGNAAASMACIGAHLNMDRIIFIPESIPRAKLVQLQIYGSKIITVQGNYDQAFDLCRKISTKRSWYNRSTAINPFNLEGKKTVAFEICEQLDFDVPDVVFVPVGDGCIISGVWKGFLDFYKVGLIDRLPRLVACQAEGSAAIFNAYKNKSDQPESVKANTIADSISVDLPRDGVKALRALRDSNGDCVIVSDQNILSAQQRLAGEKGIFCEPSAAAAFAGFLKYNLENPLGSTDKIVILITGSGMKDLDSAEKAISKNKQIIVDPEKDDVEEKLRDIKS